MNRRPQKQWRPKDASASKSSEGSTEVKSTKAKPNHQTNGHIEEKPKSKPRPRSSHTNRSVDRPERHQRPRSEQSRRSEEPSQERKKPESSPKRPKRKKQSDASPPKSTRKSQTRAERERENASSFHDRSRDTSNSRSLRKDRNSTRGGDQRTDGSLPSRRERPRGNEYKEEEEDRDVRRKRDRRNRDTGREEDRRRRRDGDWESDRARVRRGAGGYADYNGRPRPYFQHDDRGQVDYSRNSRRDRRQGTVDTRRLRRPYDETPAPVENFQNAEETEIPSKADSRPKDSRRHAYRPKPREQTRDSEEREEQLEQKPRASEHEEEYRPSTPPHERNHTETPTPSPNKSVNGFVSPHKSTDEAGGDSRVMNMDDLQDSKETAELGTAVFSLDDLDKQLRALDVVLDGLMKMHEDELVGQMRTYRDKLANSLNTQVIPQPIDSFQEVSSMARSDDGPDFGDRAGPTKPPMKKFRRAVPAVSTPQPMSGSSSRRKPPRITRNDMRRFELFGPTAWQEYQLTPQETSDVSISPDVQHRSQKGVQRTPSSSSTGMNPDVSNLNPKMDNGQNILRTARFDGFQPMYHPGFNQPMLRPSGSFGDLRVASSHHYPFPPPLSTPGAPSGVTSTGVTTPSSSVPIMAAPPGLNTMAVFGADSMQMLPQYMNGSSQHMSMPVVNQRNVIPIPNGSSVPNQIQPHSRPPLRRKGDGSYDPSRQPLLRLAVTVGEGETKEIYYYAGDNVRDVARKFCINHNILHHSTLLENELKKILRENHSTHS